jgi:hypothetical protein
VYTDSKINVMKLIHTVLKHFVVNILKGNNAASLALIFLNKAFVGGNGINLCKTNSQQHLIRYVLPYCNLSCDWVSSQSMLK